jgi:hypothetical protein
MPPSVVWLGRNPSTPDPELAALSGGNMLGYVPLAATSQHLWAVEFRYRAGRSGVSDATARAALFRMVSGIASGQLGYSEAATLSVPMTTAAGGDWITSAVSVVGGEAGAAIPITSGTQPLLVVLATGASASLGMIGAASIEPPPHNTSFYRRIGLSQPPPDPYGTPSISNEGHLTIGLKCWTNEAPVICNNRTPGSSNSLTPQAIQSQSPEFAGDHRDRNGPWGTANSGYDAGDYMSQYRIQLQQKISGSWSTIWQPTFEASPAERASGHFAVTYPGTLTRGDDYRWRVQTADHFGAWWDWSTDSAWLYFVVSALGTVTLEGNPTGKVEDNTPDFDFSWEHATPLSTEGVQLRLYRDTTLVHTSAEIAKTVASGASGTISWAESGAGTPYASGLTWGQTWYFSVRGKDTSDQWTDWSEQRQFKTNAPPGIPDGLSPSSSQIVTSYPLLTFTLIDPDDLPAGDLIGKVRIKNSGGTVLFTRTATYNSGTGRFEYQTDGTDLATYATYRWDAYGYDGALYSGAKTVEANATTSAEAVFVFADGPTVTVSAPVDEATITSSTPTIEWTGEDQNRYRITIYYAGTNEIAYQRGWITSPLTDEWTIPAGYLRNVTDYELDVEVEDTAPLQGSSGRIAFSTSYTPPDDPTGVQALPYALGTDPFPSAILVQAEPATGGDLFVGRYIYRDDLTDRPLVVLSSASDTAFIDPFPISGRLHTYTWRDVFFTDTSESEMIESPGVTVSAVVDLRGSVLASVNDPAGRRSYLTSVQTRDRALKRDRERLTGWTVSKPTRYKGLADYWEVDLSIRIKGHSVLTALEQAAEFEELLLADETMCYRDERGRKYFVTFDRESVTDARVMREDATFGLIEEDHFEGYRVLDLDLEVLE